MNLINIPEYWQIVTVGEIASQESGSCVTGPFGSSIGKKFWVDNGVPVIRGNNLTVTGAKFIDKNYIFITEEYANNQMKRYHAVADDIIFTAAGTIGQVGIISETTQFPYYIISNKQMRLRVNKKIVNPLFAFYYFRTKFLYNLIQNNNTGSTIPLINLGVLKSLPFPLPSLYEQDKIASILYSLDDKIELNLEMNKTLEEMAMAIYKEWFVDFGPFRDGEFVDSELGPIPKGWEVMKIEDISNLSIGRTPPRKEKQWFSTNSKNNKWISIKDMGNSGLYITDSNEYLIDEAISRFNIPIIPKNTVIISFKLTVGRVVVTTENMLSNEAIAHIKLKQDFKSFTEYIYLFLKNYNYHSLGSTSSIATAVNSKTIKEIHLLNPRDQIVRKFIDTVKPFFELIKSNIYEIGYLKNTRDYLLPKLISGEVRVKASEEKVKEVL